MSAPTLPASRRARALARHELRLLARYRILHAVGFVTLVWIALLGALPGGALPTALPLVLVAEATVVGLFFLAGLTLFERDEHTDAALDTAPVSAGLRLGVRVGALAVLGVGVGVLLAVATVLLGPAPLPRLGLVVAGVAGAGVLNLLVARLVVDRVESITDYVIAVQGPLIPLALPALDLLGWVESGWWWLIPSHGPMRLLGAATDTAAPAVWEVLAGMAVPALAAAALGALVLTRPRTRR